MGVFAVFCFEGGERSTTGNLEPALGRAGPNPGKEERMEENPRAGEEQGLTMGSGKCRWVLAVTGAAGAVSPR